MRDEHLTERSGEAVQRPSASDRAHWSGESFAQPPAPIASREEELASELAGEVAMRREFEKMLKAAYHALRSYQNGNDSPELAEEIANLIAPIVDEAATPGWGG